jgi:hypothetical protein
MIAREVKEATKFEQIIYAVAFSRVRRGRREGNHHKGAAQGGQTIASLK